MQAETHGLYPHDTMRMILDEIRGLRADMQKQKPKVVAKPKLSVETTQFLAELHPTWLEAVGGVEMGLFIKKLSVLKPHPDQRPDWIEAITLFGCEMRAQKPGQRNFYTIHQFTQRAGEFLKLAQMPHMADGALTARGLLHSTPEAT